jgi:type I restriction enzyme, S subunit
MTTKWPLTKLGKVVTLVMGQAPAGSDCNRDGIGTPFVKVGEFGIERPVIREWTTDPKKLARYTDVLICVVGATCGKINLGQDCAIGRSVAAIRPKPDLLEQRYLWYFMQGKVLEMRQGSQGAAQTVINREMINGLVIPIPPIEHQRRIVAKLDDASNGIEAATANALKKVTILAELKQSLLQKAFDGELT